MTVKFSFHIYGSKPPPPLGHRPKFSLADHAEPQLQYRISIEVNQNLVPDFEAAHFVCLYSVNACGVLVLCGRDDAYGQGRRAL